MGSLHDSINSLLTAHFSLLRAHRSLLDASPQQVRDRRVRLGSLLVATVRVGAAPVGIGRRVVGLQADRFVQVRNRQVILAPVEPRKTAPRIGRPPIAAAAGSPS